MPPQHGTRILAIDLRPQRFGYAVFEGSSRLLDWGVANYRPGGEIGAISARKTTEKLLTIFRPAAIIVRKVRGKREPKSPGVQPILKAIRRLVSVSAVSVRLVTRANVRTVFRPRGARTKYEIASTLATIFPELLWRLPRERKIYEGEPSAMTIFDAVALGFTYWQLKGDPSESAPSNPFAGPAGDE